MRPEVEGRALRLTRASLLKLHLKIFLRFWFCREVFQLAELLSECLVPVQRYKDGYDNQDDHADANADIVAL